MDQVDNWSIKNIIMSGAVQKRRKELRTELSLIEKQIFDLETTYLEETRDLGMYVCMRVMC